MSKIHLLLLCSILSFATVAQETMQRDSMLIDGYMRYYYSIAPIHKNKRANLVFVLHGSTASGPQAAKGAGDLIQKAKHGQNICFVFPEGYKTYWNECRKASTAETNLLNIDENTFFKRLVEQFQKAYKINKTLAIGTSGGGHMAYKLALEMPEMWDGIGVIIANMPTDENCDCVQKRKKMPIVIVNGTSDPTNPYNGGEMNLGNWKAGRVRSTEESFGYWAKLAGYKGMPRKELLPDKVPTDGKTIEKNSYKSIFKPQVCLLKVINGVHSYPADIDVHTYIYDMLK
jgi:polyhydroxybutyrate depolymerase